MTAATTVLAAAGAVLGVLVTIRTEHTRRRMQQQMRDEIVLKLAAHSIVLKHGEMIPPLESQEVRRTANRWRQDLLVGRLARSASRLGAVNFLLRTRRGWLAARPAWPASGLTSVASFLLPAADRARYSEEYRSELWELAQAGAGRIRQLRYALRQLRNALPMGFALRSPRRRSAAP
jgi:hypothetical protein